MAEQDIIQNLIFQLGQSQSDRLPKELGTHFADIDERTTADLLRFTKALAEFVNYYRHSSDAPIGDWRNFFPKESEIDAIAELLKNENTNTASTSPHLALFLAFLELYKQPQSIINQITARHLDFYYQDVLRLQKKTAIPDKVHLLIELKKNVAPIRIAPENLFSAGNDATNVELLYAPTRETIVNSAKVESLRSLFFDRQGRGTIRYAPIANSSDGLGGKLKETDPKWSGFGDRNLPPAEVGFAIASPVLRMQEGTRKIDVSLQLTDVDATQLNNASLHQAFDVSITGAKNWLGTYTVSPSLSVGNMLIFSFTVPETEAAIVDYDPTIHGYSYSDRLPVLKILLRANNPNLGYRDFRNVTLQTATISVEVSNITALQLESDSGTLDPKKAFLPFGPQPTAGSRFLIDYPEALAKKLSEITLKVQWKDAPTDFSSRYSGYGVSVNNSSFTAAVAFNDGGSWVNASTGVQLFNSSNATALHTLTLPPRSGEIALFLERDFLHSTYRTKYVEYVVKYSKEGKDLTILKEPYTPTIQSISLAYKAHSDTVNISSTAPNDFANSCLHFFHISYFGQMREHGYQRQQIEDRIRSGINTVVPLLPSYSHAGELLIGLSQLNGGDSVGVLFQVAEGTANPDLPSEDLQWFVLCDNYWKPLNRSEVLLDTTNRLLTSGIIQFVIPPEATTHNTILPSGSIWLKAAIRISPAIADNVTAVCQLVDVIANAVEVQFANRDNDPRHLLTALPPGKITKLENGLSAVKTVQQPYASFGGSAEEIDDAFHARVSERLRHKNRAIAAWDYERLILEAFSKVHQVKCIPHAKENAWLVPGHVLIVVIPDLKHKNTMNLLEPKVDADTIDRITTYVQKRAGMQVKIQVKNPRYQRIQMDFKVEFYPGYEFNYYKTQLDREIVRFLSPWAYESDRDISFGGKIYKSVILDFVEDLPYVDYVTDFKMYSPIAGTTKNIDLNEIQPHTPDTILVSISNHIINPVT
ncbi:baseplate J/gp47 family protein [Pseudanabaena sp. PCC 6802]|uniref:baseplate J/gp47 family protein n=1 Tax=Pseudanabaena sp. PCC 6802 TaxID=118173 RepID=UPI0003477882|nr:baseplate J/gp47 family protein [Pseudanabaena sp. PCC 6802]